MEQWSGPQLDQLPPSTDEVMKLFVVVGDVLPAENAAIKSEAEQARLAVERSDAIDQLSIQDVHTADIVILSDSALDEESIESLNHLLAMQATWSELPIVVLADGDWPNDRVSSLGNVTVLRRPVDECTLSSILQTAIRARQSQYRVMQLLEERRRASAERKRHEHDAQFLAAASAALSSTLDYKLTLKTLTQLAVPLFADWCAVYLRRDDGELSLLAVSHADPEKLATMRDRDSEFAAAFTPPRGVVQVFRTGVPERVQLITDDMLQRAARDDEHLRQLRVMALQSYMCVPMIARGETIGAITFVSAESGRSYLEEDLRFAHELASRAAVAVENARLYGAAQAEIAERKTAERALIENRERLSFALSAGRMGTWSRNLSEDAVYCSPEMLAFFGREASDEPITVATLGSLVHPDDRARVERMISAAVENHEGWGIECRSPVVDGQVRWFVAHGHAGYDVDGKPVRTAGVIVEITERKRTEEQLRALNETLEQRVAERTAVAEQRADQLRALAAELTQAEQRERRRLARMLHDHLQQLLVAAKLSLSGVRGRLDNDEYEAALEHVEELLNESVDASRTLTIELSPPVLYDAGLAPALDWLARWMKTQHGLHVEVIADVGRVDTLAEDIKVLLFQAIRELLFNIVKHANTREAQVVVVASRAQIQIMVSDDGEGFEVETLVDRTEDHFGLFSLRERLGQVGGYMDILSEPGLGTRVKLIAPLPAAEPVPSPEQADLHPEHDAATVECVRAADSGRLRVLLADDHSIFREGLAELLRSQQFIDVVGEASDGQQALEMARQLRPDVVIMDVTMPVMNGIEATRRISSELPDVCVIGLSMHQQDDMENAMRQAGAAAYLPKGGPSENLISMLRKVV